MILRLFPLVAILLLLLVSSSRSSSSSSLFVDAAAPTRKQNCHPDGKTCYHEFRCDFSNQVLLVENEDLGGAGLEVTTSCRSITIRNIHCAYVKIQGVSMSDVPQPPTVHIFNVTIDCDVVGFQKDVTSRANNKFGFQNCSKKPSGRFIQIDGSFNDTLSPLQGEIVLENSVVRSNTTALKTATEFFHLNCGALSLGLLRIRGNKWLEENATNLVATTRSTSSAPIVFTQIDTTLWVLVTLVIENNLFLSTNRWHEGGSRKTIFFKLQTKDLIGANCRSWTISSNNFTVIGPDPRFVGMLPQISLFAINQGPAFYRGVKDFARVEISNNYVRLEVTQVDASPYLYLLGFDTSSGRIGRFFYDCHVVNNKLIGNFVGNAVLYGVHITNPTLMENYLRLNFSGNEIKYSLLGESTSTASIYGFSCPPTPSQGSLSTLVFHLHNNLLSYFSPDGVLKAPGTRMHLFSTGTNRGRNQFVIRDTIIDCENNTLQHVNGPAPEMKLFTINVNLNLVAYFKSARFVGNLLSSKTSRASAQDHWERDPFGEKSVQLILVEMKGKPWSSETGILSVNNSIVFDFEAPIRRVQHLVIVLYHIDSLMGNFQLAGGGGSTASSHDTSFISENDSIIICPRTMNPSSSNNNNNNALVTLTVRETIEIVAAKFDVSAGKHKGDLRSPLKPLLSLKTFAVRDLRVDVSCHLFRYNGKFPSWNTKKTFKIQISLLRIPDLTSQNFEIDGVQMNFLGNIDPTLSATSIPGPFAATIASIGDVKVSKFRVSNTAQKFPPSMRVASDSNANQTVFSAVLITGYFNPLETTKNTQVTFENNSIHLPSSALPVLVAQNSSSGVPHDVFACALQFQISSTSSFSSMKRAPRTDDFVFRNFSVSFPATTCSSSTSSSNGGDKRFLAKTFVASAFYGTEMFWFDSASVTVEDTNINLVSPSSPHSSSSSLNTCSNNNNIIIAITADFFIISGAYLNSSLLLKEQTPNLAVTVRNSNFRLSSPGGLPISDSRYYSSNSNNNKYEVKVAVAGFAFPHPVRPVLDSKNLPETLGAIKAMLTVDNVKVELEISSSSNQQGSPMKFFQVVKRNLLVTLLHLPNADSVSHSFKKSKILVRLGGGGLEVLLPLRVSLFDLRRPDNEFKNRSSSSSSSSSSVGLRQISENDFELDTQGTVLTFDSSSSSSSNNNNNNNNNGNPQINFHSFVNLEMLQSNTILVVGNSVVFRLGEIKNNLPSSAGEIKLYFAFLVLMFDKKKFSAHTLSVAQNNFELASTPSICSSSSGRCSATFLSYCNNAGSDLSLCHFRNLSAAFSSSARLASALSTSSFSSLTLELADSDLTLKDNEFTLFFGIRAQPALFMFPFGQLKSSSLTNLTVRRCRVSTSSTPLPDIFATPLHLFDSNCKTCFVISSCAFSKLEATDLFIHQVQGVPLDRLVIEPCSATMTLSLSRTNSSTETVSDTLPETPSSTFTELATDSSTFTETSTESLPETASRSQSTTLPPTDTPSQTHSSSFTSSESQTRSQESPSFSDSASLPPECLPFKISCFSKTRLERENLGLRASVAVLVCRIVKKQTWGEIPDDDMSAGRGNATAVPAVFERTMKAFRSIRTFSGPVSATGLKWKSDSEIQVLVQLNTSFSLSRSHYYSLAVVQTGAFFCRFPDSLAALETTRLEFPRRFSLVSEDAVVALQGVSQTAAFASFVASQLGSRSGSTSGIASAMRSQQSAGVMKALECSAASSSSSSGGEEENDDDGNGGGEEEPLEPIVSPMLPSPFSISPAQGTFARGAVLGNVFVLLIFFGIASLVTFIYAVRRMMSPKKRSEAHRGFVELAKRGWSQHQCPVRMIIAFYLLADGILQGALTLIAIKVQKIDVLIAALGLVFILGLGGFAAYKILSNLVFVGKGNHPVARPFLNDRPEKPRAIDSFWSRTVVYSFTLWVFRDFSWKPRKLRDIERLNMKTEQQEDEAEENEEEGAKNMFLKALEKKQEEKQLLEKFEQEEGGGTSSSWSLQEKKARAEENDPKSDRFAALFCSSYSPLFEAFYPHFTHAAVTFEILLTLLPTFVGSFAVTPDSHACKVVEVLSALIVASSLAFSLQFYYLRKFDNLYNILTCGAVAAQTILILSARLVQKNDLFAVSESIILLAVTIANVFKLVLDVYENFFNDLEEGVVEFLSEKLKCCCRMSAPKRRARLPKKKKNSSNKNSTTATASEQEMEDQNSAGGVYEI